MKLFKTLFVLLTLILFFLSAAPGLASSVKKMSKEELKQIMGTDTVSILDVRQGRDWSSSEFKIKNAERMDLKNIVADAKKYPKDQTLVLYCA